MFSPLGVGLTAWKRRPAGKTGSSWHVRAATAVQTGRATMALPIPNLPEGTMTTPQRTCVDEFLTAVESGAIAGCTAWSPDAVVDATVPNWRFQVTGADAIRTEYARWFADPGSFEHLRRLPTADGEVLEYTLTWSEDGVGHAAHHMHLLTVDDDQIVADTVLCGGRWPAALLAEMGTTGA